METGENNMNQSTEGTQTNTQSAPSVTAGEKNTLMGVLAYLSILVIIPYLTAKNDPFVAYHIKQGLVLVVIEAAVWVLGMMVWGLYTILMIVNLATLVLSIIGIVNVLQGKEKELPFVGQFSKYFSNI